MNEIDNDTKGACITALPFASFNDDFLYLFISVNFYVGEFSSFIRITLIDQRVVYD
jgi:hypothetical protein